MPVAPEYQVAFELPPDFREILIGADDEEIRTAVHDRVGADRIEDVPGLLLKQMVTEYRRASWQMAAAGAFYSASCFGLIEEGRPSSASVLLAHQEADCSDPETTVAGIIEIRTREDHAERRQVGRYELPCGPAAVEIELGAGMVIPAELSPTGEDEPIPVATLQAWIPVPRTADPSGRSLTVLTFSTPAVHDWETYCPVVVEMLRTVSFTGAGEPAQAAPAVPSPRISDAFG
ncbi:hypothetical protein GCM10010193_19900 [Kitasatospora atroaurantiaca]|uniref:Uncharacterized protein n=1 Tax=Kitasatospora atroaurantiaca TaxID=285545 RepID=A0A561EPP2_9ACTN|nr:hypothetical protein [Kitasatospora atroaurantiaca]TWE17578.1 hypothetical protein FB465_2613 [Kitasatospora atroaurantiaca]